MVCIVFVTRRRLRDAALRGIIKPRPSGPIATSGIAQNPVLTMSQQVQLTINDGGGHGPHGSEEFILSASYESYPCWQTHRTFEDMVQLQNQLIQKNSFDLSSSFVTESLQLDAQDLQKKFNALFAELGSFVWNNEDLVTFLGGSTEQCIVTTIRLRHLTDQVARLSAELADHSNAIKSVQTNQQFLLGMVQNLLQGQENNTTAKKAHPKREDLLRSLHVTIPHPAASTCTTVDGGDSADERNGATSSHSSSFLSINTPDISTSGAPTFVLPASARSLASTSGAGSSCSTDICDHSGAHHHRGIPTDSDAFSPTPLRGELANTRRMTFPEPIAEAESPVSASAVPTALQLRGPGSSCASVSAPATPHFPVTLHPSDAMCAFYASAVDHILSTVQPSNAHMHYRYSVITMLRKQIRLSLNCSAFATGLHDILCSLPDDPIALTVIVGKAQLSSWHAVLTDRLNLVNERLATSGNVELVYPEEEETLANLPDDYKHPLRHEVNSVSHTKLNVSYCVQLQIDNAMEVEVLANNRHELCLLAFLEEVAALVGKDDLFKRSLLLIRAWWFYETAAYVGTPIKHYLKDPNIAIMVCAIFNQYHARINSPLQALCLFLAEYSAYDGATQAITLQGIVPFRSATSSQPMLHDAQASHLINCEIIEKHWNLFNVNASNGDAAEFSSAAAFLRSSSSDDVHNDDQTVACIALGGQGGSNPNLVGELGNDPVLRSAPGGIEKVTMKNLSAHNLHYFERQVFNIVHPFNHTNMVTEKLSARRQMRLHKAFQIGATDVTVYLRQSIDNADNAGDFMHFFPNLLARFGDGTTNSASGAGAGYSPGKPLIDGNSEFSALAPVNPKYYSSVEDLNAHIMYCNMMLECVLSEPALLTLSTEILAVKGPLPVGEIGKLLAETTSIGNMSQKLKEKFGGLKKFLERFQNVFVISNDHPFNPNVLLRSSLTAEHLSLIDRGIFPHQLLQKTKKAAAPSSKKKKSNSMTGSMLSNEYNNLVGPQGSGQPGAGQPPGSGGSPYTGHSAHKMIGSPALGVGSGSTGTLGGSSAGGSPAFGNAASGAGVGVGGGIAQNQAAKYANKGSTSSPSTTLHKTASASASKLPQVTSPQQQSQAQQPQQHHLAQQGQGPPQPQYGYFPTNYPPHSPLATHHGHHGLYGPLQQTQNGRAMQLQAPPPPGPQHLQSPNGNNGLYPQHYQPQHGFRRSTPPPPPPQGMVSPHMIYGGGAGGFQSHNSSASSLLSGSTNTTNPGGLSGPFNRSFRAMSELHDPENNFGGLEPSATFRLAHTSRNNPLGSAPGGVASMGGAGGGGQAQTITHFDDLFSAGPGGFDSALQFGGPNQLLSNLRLSSQDLPTPASSPDEHAGSRPRLQSTGSHYGYLSEEGNHSQSSGQQQQQSALYPGFGSYRSPLAHPGASQRGATQQGQGQFLYGPSSPPHPQQQQTQNQAQAQAQHQQLQGGGAGQQGPHTDPFVREYSTY